MRFGRHITIVFGQGTIKVLSSVGKIPNASQNTKAIYSEYYSKLVTNIPCSKKLLSSVIDN